jgi:hypothetical protein
MQRRLDWDGRQTTAQTMAGAGSKTGESEKLGASERMLSVEQVRDAAHVAAQGLRLGKSPAQIVARLREQGLTLAEAQGIEDHIRLACQRSHMRIGTMLMVSGVLWAIASILAVIARPGTKTAQYSSLILLAAILQWLYGWHRRRKARKIRPMFTDRR